MSAQTEIDDLFARYLKAWNGRDFKGVAACTTEPGQFILPDVTVPVPDREAMVNLPERIHSRLEAEGFSHGKIGEVTAQACEEDLAIVDARDVRLPEVIDGHHSARRTEGAWQFTTAISCRQGWQRA